MLIQCKCGFKINTQPGTEGLTDKCPNCQTVFKIPGATTTESHSSKSSRKIYILIGGIAGLLVILGVFLFSAVDEPSLESLQQSLRRGDRESRLETLKKIKKYGTRVIPDIMKICSDQDKELSSASKDLILEMGQPALQYLVDVLKNNDSPMDQRIIAAELIGKSGVNTPLEDLQKSFPVEAKDSPLRKWIINSIIQIDGTLLKNYTLFRGNWLTIKEMEELGYIDHNNKWTLKKDILKPVKERIEQIKSVSSESLNIYHDILKDMEKLDKEFLDDKEMQDLIKAEYVRVYDQIIEYINSVYEKGREEEKDTKIIKAISTYNTGLENLKTITNWPYFSFYDKEKEFPQISRKFEEAGKTLREKAQMGVIISITCPEERNAELIQQKIISGLSERLETQDRLAVIVNKAEANQKNLKDWLSVSYNEVKGQQGFREIESSGKPGKIVPSVRLICTISYWKKEENKPNWEETVVGENEQSIDKKPDVPLGKFLYEAAFSNFEKNMKEWTPDFTKKEIAQDEPSSVVKGSTFQEETFYDRILKKGGGELEGVILSEDDKVIQILAVYRKQHQRTLIMKTMVAKKDIEKIERLSDQKRAEALEKLENIQSQKADEDAAIGKIKLVKIPWEFVRGKEGLKFESKRFILFSDASEEFTKRAAYRMEEIFKAYESYFKVTREASEKVKIFIFNTSVEYYAVLGYSVKNPAVYIPAKKIVLAGTDLTLYYETVKQIKQQHSKILEAVEDQKVVINKIRNEIRDKKKDEKNKIEELYKNKKISMGQANAYLDQVRSWEDQQMTIISLYEKKYREYEDQIHECNYRNITLINKYAGALITMLYHETFHAFLDSYLFRKETVSCVPIWLNEGMAQFFENSFIEGEELRIGSIDKRRANLLCKYINERKIVPVERLLTSSSDSFIVTDALNIETSHIHYLQSWALVYYLSTQFNLRKGNFFEPYVEEIWKGKDSKESFKTLTGKSPKEIDNVWQNAFLNLVK